MRSIQVEKVRDAVRDMCIEANYSLSPDMRCVFEKACQEEKSPLGRQILNQLSENLEIAKKDEIPICQDTGMAVVFLEVGQEVHFEGGSLEGGSAGRNPSWLYRRIPSEIRCWRSRSASKYRGQYTRRALL